uniref:Gypsy retrotransposon integrase-like protein 1 n=1 Tax=Leptobrachium leishanense TaxID=445787 RepID=A0A8C5QB65_9ANUR
MVVPQGPRQELLRLAHDIPLAGHLGQKKTRHRLARAFFWPRLSEDTREFCRTCPVCQKAGKAGDHPKAPLHPMPIIQEPFSRVAVDLIGPLPRPSATGKRYILTIVDYATRYPEAVALANIQADTVADALLRVFTRVGFHREILSDQGTQFTAELTQQLWRLCGVKALHSTPYHPQTNGLCERFNGTLKQLIRAFAHERKDWEQYLPHLLFAYREVPQESTGYSPFELLYGRQVRGPLDLVRAQWEGKQEEDGVPVVSYVLKLRERLAELAGLVRGNRSGSTEDVVRPGCLQPLVLCGTEGSGVETTAAEQAAGGLARSLQGGNPTGGYHLCGGELRGHQNPTDVPRQYVESFPRAPGDSGCHMRSGCRRDGAVPPGGVTGGGQTTLWCGSGTAGGGVGVREAGTSTTTASGVLRSFFGSPGLHRSGRSSRGHPRSAAPSAACVPSSRGSPGNHADRDTGDVGAGGH